MNTRFIAHLWIVTGIFLSANAVAEDIPPSVFSAGLIADQPGSGSGGTSAPYLSYQLKDETFFQSKTLDKNNKGLKMFRDAQTTIDAMIYADTDPDPKNVGRIGGATFKATHPLFRAYWNVGQGDSKNWMGTGSAIYFEPTVLGEGQHHNSTQAQTHPSMFAAELGLMVGYATTSNSKDFRINVSAGFLQGGGFADINPTSKGRTKTMLARGELEIGSDFWASYSLQRRVFEDNATATPWTESEICVNYQFCSPFVASLKITDRKIEANPGNFIRYGQARLGVGVAF